MNVLDAWLAQVTADLGLDPDQLDRGPILDLTRDVAHGVARPAAPVTAYLVGLAAGRAGGTPDDVTAAVRRARQSVSDWTAHHPPEE